MKAIAEGFYSEVFLHDNKILKVYKPESAFTQAAAELFACEVQVMKDLQDLPFVPSVLKHNKEFCEMTYMPGETLDTCNIYLLKENAQTILDAVDSFAWLVYERGYLINDVHLGNILADYSIGLSFIDFNSYIRVDNQADVIARHHHFADREYGYSGTRAAAIEFIKFQLTDIKNQIVERLASRGFNDGKALFYEWETC